MFDQSVASWHAKSEKQKQQKNNVLSAVRLSGEGIKNVHCQELQSIKTATTK